MYEIRYGTNPTTPSCQDESESAFAGFEGLLVPGNIKIEDDGKDVVAGKHSQVVTANKMLADLLERKSSDPPFNVSGDISNKRKIDANANPTFDEPSAKRFNIIENFDNVNDNSKKNVNKSTSSAANLYAELAASLLEDEDMEIEQQQQQQPQQSVISASPMVEQPKSVITVPMQRQIIVSPNNGKTFSQRKLGEKWRK